MSDRQVHEGGCLCGGIRYHVEGDRSLICYCHCRMCQRAIGAAVTAWGSVPAKNFQILRGQVVEYESSPRMRRGFCGNCGASLTGRYTLKGESWVDFTLATLDDPSLVVPTYHVHMASRIPWFNITDELPRHDDRGDEPIPD